jgi:hypothetical protein
MCFKGHGSQVKVHIMLLLVANNCWIRSFALGYWLFYFSSVFDSDEERKSLQVKEWFKWVCMLPYLPLPLLGTVNDVTVNSFIVSNQLVAGSIMVRHMKLILVLSLPLRVYCLMRSIINALWGVIMTSFDSTWLYFWLCLLFLARSARFGVTGWYVHTFSVHHGFHCLLETWVARVLKVTLIPTDFTVPKRYWDDLFLSLYSTIVSSISWKCK